MVSAKYSLFSTLMRYIHPRYRILTGAQTRRRKEIDAPEEDETREQVRWRGKLFSGKGLLSEILVGMD